MAVQYSSPNSAQQQQIQALQQQMMASGLDAGQAYGQAARAVAQANNLPAYAFDQFAMSQGGYFPDAGMTGPLQGATPPGAGGPGVPATPQVPQVPLNFSSQEATTQFGPTFNAWQTQAGNMLTNPNQISPFGSQNVTIDPATGQPIVQQQLSDANQQVLGGIQGGGMAANQQLQNLIQGFMSPGSGQTSALEDAVFQNLTRGLDEQKRLEQEQLEQTLANRGIPQGSELWNNQLEELGERYDQRFDAARNQAVQTGIGTSLSAIPMFAGVGQNSFFAPQFQGFQSNPFQQIDPQALFGAGLEAQLTREGYNTDRYIANRRGSGGGFAVPQPSMNFNIVPPPGSSG